ncbi:MAG: hypothetical protein ACRDJV_00610 [Actinomycetota bacterium]
MRLLAIVFALTRLAGPTGAALISIVLSAVVITLRLGAPTHRHD